MNRRITKIAPVFALIVLIAIASLLTYKHSGATTGPLPPTLDVYGTNPGLLGPIQNMNGSWTITFDYTPLNQSGSIIVLDTSMRIVTSKVQGGTEPGQIVLPVDYNSPVYIATAGATWHLTAH